MGAVDIANQKTAAYRLNHKKKYRFYLEMFFVIIDVAIVNSHIGHTVLGNEISLLNFKIIVAKALIGRYSNCKRSFPISAQSKNLMNHPFPKKSKRLCLSEVNEVNKGSDH